ncbi:MAG: class I SAM-dependent methyltransferase [bacterium]|nr:class I SAM-dependent methyltransferase [bacterium]
MSNPLYKEITKCRVCRSANLTPILSLGDLYVSNFFADAKAQEKNAVKAPLELVLCNEKDGGCGLLQLKHSVDPEEMYRNYWYRSGINKSMTDELVGIVKKVEAIVPLSSGDFIIDIGSNDGTLLRAYGGKGLNRIGFEPARALAEKYGLEGITHVFTDFFSFSALHAKFGNAKAKIVTAIAMFYDLDDPNMFVGDIVKCMDDDGLLVVQMMYLPSFLKRNAFDGICHEHLEYYSLLSLENLLKRHGLEVIDAEMREHVNEGSIRVYVRKVGMGKSLRLQPGASERVQAFRREEKALGLDDKRIYEEFVRRVLELKEMTITSIKKEVAAGKTVFAYAASTKGNTTLQFFGLTPDLVTAIADRNPDKWGTKTVGTMIPIISEEEFRNKKPDYVLILAWHFLPEFLKREADYLKAGGKFIVPMPEFKIIGGEDLQ